MQTVISELVLNLCNINITFYVFIWRQYCVLLCGCLVYNELQILLSIVGTISKWIWVQFWILCIYCMFQQVALKQLMYKMVQILQFMFLLQWAFYCNIWMKKGCTSSIFVDPPLSTLFFQGLYAFYNISLPPGSTPLSSSHWVGPFGAKFIFLTRFNSTNGYCWNIDFQRFFFF